MKTVSVDLVARSGDAAVNSCTSAVSPFVVACDFRMTFMRNYSVFASRLREVDEPAVAMVAIDLEEDRVAGMLRLAARPDRITAGIIGRHGCADLFVDGPASLSLRHLA